MKIKRHFKTLLITLLSVLVSYTASAKNKEQTVLRDGISFSILEGWKIIANDSIGENAYYLSVESTGLNATGLITITWVNKVENPQKTINLHQRTMKSANIYRNPGIEFSEVVTENFAGINVESSRYTTIVKEKKLEGIIYCFNSAQKTISIFFQSGLSDQKNNQKAFDLIRKTFNCRE